MTTTPHHVGQVAKARITVAALLDGAPDPDALAGRVVDALADLGWTPPRDPTADIPPARGTSSQPETRAWAREHLAAALADVRAQRATRSSG